jgi:hypothetical protein
MLFLTIFFTLSCFMAFGKKKKNNSPHQTIPLDTPIPVRVLEKDTFQLGTCNIYQFYYKKHRKRFFGIVLVDEDIDSLRKPPFDTSIILTRNRGYKIKGMEAWADFFLTGCHVIERTTIILDSKSKQKIDLDFNEDAKLPTLKLSNKK